MPPLSIPARCILGRDVQRIWPRHVQTVGAMIDGAVPVFAHCSRCQTSFKVDLGLLVKAYGRELSLVNRVGPCPRLACEGKAHFLAQEGANRPFTVLRDR